MNRTWEFFARASRVRQTMPTGLARLVVLHGLRPLAMTGDEGHLWSYRTKNVILLRKSVGRFRKVYPEDTLRVMVRIAQPNLKRKEFDLAFTTEPPLEWPLGRAWRRFATPQTMAIVRQMRSS